MGKFVKKVKINQIVTIDKKRMKEGKASGPKLLKTKLIRHAYKMSKETDYIERDKLELIKSVGRAHSLWLQLLVLKECFRFTSKQLLEFKSRIMDVYKYAIDDTSAGDVYDIIKHTVQGNSKDDPGNMDYPEYKQTTFDADGSLMDNYIARFPNPVTGMKNYKMISRTYYEMEKGEVAAMLVLKDYFGFARKRLKRFTETVRNYFGENAVAEYGDRIEYLEKLCKTKIAEFDCIRKGQGILYQIGAEI